MISVSKVDSFWGLEMGICISVYYYYSASGSCPHSQVHGPFLHFQLAVLRLSGHSSVATSLSGKDSPL